MNKLMPLFRSLIERLSFNFNVFNVIELVIMAATFPLMFYADPQLFVEDGIVENLQLLVLIICFMVALNAKHDKPLYNLTAMIVLLMIARELNMGRPYLCHYLGIDMSQCSWKNIPYGYIANIVRGLFGVYIIYYAFKTKVANIIIKYLKNAPIYIWDILFVVGGAVLATLAEKPFDNEILEETSETLFYFAVFGLIMRYKNNLQTTKE